MKDKIICELPMPHIVVHEKFCSKPTINTQILGLKLISYYIIIVIFALLELGYRKMNYPFAWMDQVNT